MKKQLEELLHHEIPITKAMGLTVHRAEKEIVELKAALPLNINHKQSAFGGSLNTLATLAGWGLIWLHCSELDFPCEIVIQSGKSEYKKAVRDDLMATCLAPDAKKLSRFLKSLDRHGKARLKLDVSMNHNSLLFEGSYVVFKR